MCGFAGIVDWGAAPELPVVREMTQAIRHRGPDDSGDYADADCALGHARLSIIDLSPAGRQPMTNEDGTVQVVYNGELYNFTEQRARLEAAGHTFRSRTDTETIVHLYEEHGDRFVEHIRGMFAIAIWDARRKRLILARDRFGQKPLFYARAGGRLIFASEIKALLRHPAVPRDIDPRAVDLFLTLHFVPSPYSFYAAIRRLPPASLLTFEPGGVPAVRRYWSLPSGEPSRLSFEEAEEEVDAHLTRAVREQLVADVPVGLLLSGGIDSSLVLSKAADVAPRIDTFSIGYEEQQFSELRHAQRVAEAFKSRHHAVVLRAQDVRDPERLLDLFDEPFADVAALPQVALAETSRRHVKVALTGDGGDELFGGYEHHVLGYWLDRTRAARPLRTGAARALRLLPRFGTLGRRGRSLDRALEVVAEGGWHSAAIALRSTLSPDRRSTLYEQGFMDVVGDQDPYPYLDSDPLPNGHAHGVERLFRIAGDLVLADQFLHKSDIASMSVGLECRSPFLDIPLAEFVSTLPVDLKVKGLRGKRILRSLLARRIGPDITERKKMGLSMPIDEWIKHELAPLVRDTILAPGARVHVYARRQEIAVLYGEHLSGRANRRRILWALLLLELWLRRREQA
jgi:asparagine synthase (glutamine-hydrolysing)